MAVDTCGTCVYLFSPDPKNLANTGCRRNPPDILPLPDRTGGLSISGVYPPVRSNTTACGEHKPKMVS